MEDVTVGNEDRFLADACDELAAAFIGTTAALRALAADWRPDRSDDRTVYRPWR